MTYLSKVPLNPLRKGTRWLLANPQRVHAAVLGGIAEQPVNERVLWRLEPVERAPHLLVLTRSRPSWEHVVEQAGWPGAEGGSAQIAEYEPLLALIMQGRSFRFRLKANPVSAVRRPEAPTASQAELLEGERRRRGTRVGHRSVAHQLAWFLDRASDGGNGWGFSVGPRDDANVSVVARERLVFSKKREMNPITLNTATFEGRLVVTDPLRFREVLLGGVGSGKAYGCGLLTVAGSDA